MPDFKQLSRSVKGLTVLVTGAASGMGRATALVFAAEGANVAVTDLNTEPALLQYQITLYPDKVVGGAPVTATSGILNDPGPHPQRQQ